MRTWLAGLVLLALLPLASGCGNGSPSGAYCDEVTSKQQELSDILSTGQPDVLIRALGIFKALQGKAPEDISDEWQQVIRAIEGLQQALADAGVDAATYDRNHPPTDLTDEERARIDAAARELGGRATNDAFASIKQQVKDVCHTALYL
ncbi:hypothetical protein [Nocardioides sp.]|uniref:hypothetical protein n=1 Tax=Nocardioides sp. TaxID=35761 RepID=UPI0031FF2490|nr:hypothetical protein [Nocardioides sp.]